MLRLDEITTLRVALLIRMEVQRKNNTATPEDKARLVAVYNKLGQMRTELQRRELEQFQ